MESLSRHTRVGVIAVIAIAAAVSLYLADWLSLRQVAELSILLVATIAISAATPRSMSTDRLAMAPSFVVDFTALLLFGPHIALIVVIAGVVANHFGDAGRPLASRLLSVNLAAGVWATQAAGLTYRIFDGSVTVGWPWQALPVIAAMAAYVVARGAFAGVVLPLWTDRRVNPQWAERALQRSPNYIVGASIAVGLAALIDQSMWAVVALVTVPLYFACRDYCAHVARVEDEHRRLEVVASLDEGMAVVDADGRITFWNDVLERL
jgi:PAS domain-containing protein